MRAGCILEERWRVQRVVDGLVTSEELVKSEDEARALFADKQYTLLAVRRPGKHRFELIERRGLSLEEVNALERCRLAALFTSPSVTARRPHRTVYSALMKKGLLAGYPMRLTERGRVALESVTRATVARALSGPK